MNGRTADDNQSIDWSAVDFSKSEQRRLKHEYLWSFGVCVKLALPMLAAIAVFVVLYFTGISVAHDLHTDSLAIYTLEQRKVGTIRVARMR